MAGTTATAGRGVPGRARRALQARRALRARRALWARAAAVSASVAEALESRALLAFAPAGPEFHVDTLPIADQSGASVAVDGDGDFVVAFTAGPDRGTGREFDVFVRRYTASGLPLGAEFQPAEITANGQVDPSVATDAAGNFVVAWETVGGLFGAGVAIRARRFSAAGEALGGEFLVNQFAGGVSSPSVAVDADGDFVVAWHSDGQDGSGTGVYARRYDSGGAPAGDEFRVNQATPGAQQAPAVAIEAGGDFVIAWQTFNQDAGGWGIYARRFNAAGEPLGNEFQVNQFATDDQAAPAVAGDADGDFVVAWQSENQGGAGYDVYARRYAASGAASGDEFRVNQVTALAQLEPSVSMDADGDFVASWSSEGQDGSSFGVYARRFPAGGSGTAGAGGELRVNTFFTNSQFEPSAAMTPAGDAVIAWSSAGQGEAATLTGVYAQRFDESTDAAGPVPAGVFDVVGRIAPGTRLARDYTPDPIVVTFSEPLATSGPGSVTNPANWQFTRFGSSLPFDSIVFGLNPINNRYEAILTPAVGLPAGDASPLAIVASDAIRDAAGNPLDGDFDGHPGGEWRHAFAVTPSSATGGEVPLNVVTAGDQVDAQVALDADGDFVVAWAAENQDGDGYGIYARLFTAAGAPRTGETLVNQTTAGGQIQAAVAMGADGGFVVTWTHQSAVPGVGHDVFARLFNAAGVAQGNEIHVDQFATGSLFSSDVAMDADGDFVVTWEARDASSYGIFARAFNAAGAPLGDQFPVNQYTTDVQRNASVAMDAYGNFTVAWDSRGQDGDAIGVYARRFRPGGVALGDEFRVNQTTTFSQSFPSVAADADGDFVVAWDGFGNGESGIFARRYDRRGAPLGGEFRVSAAGPGRIFAQVAMDRDGDFAVAWNDQQQDGAGGAGVAARRYNAAGVPQGNAFPVNVFTAGIQFTRSADMDADGDFVVAWESRDQDADGGQGVYARRFGHAPLVADGGLRFATAPQQVALRFTDDVGASLAAGDLAIINRTTGQTVSAAAMDFSYTAAERTGVWTFPGLPGGVLPNGNYRATLVGTGVSGKWGLALRGAAAPGTNHVFDFFVLAGDVNRDRRVDGADFALLASNFGRLARVYRHGDLNGDGRVDGADFATLAANFGRTVPPPAALVPAAAPAPATPVLTAPRRVQAPPAQRPVRLRTAYPSRRTPSMTLSGPAVGTTRVRSNPALS